MRLSPSLRSLVARALLGVLLLGSACHLWHHLADPSCGAEVGHKTQPCATCASLHSSATATESVDGSEPHAVALAAVSTNETAARAPPAA
jgi:hypothetical protein